MERFAAILILVGAGCDTISSDLQDVASALIPKNAGEAARMAADSVDSDERREGIVLLSNASFGGEDLYVKLYREYAVYDRDPIVRAVSIRALARHGRPEDAVLMADNLNHENVQVRWEAAKGLQRLHHPPIVPRMLAILARESEWSDVRAALARGLGQYTEDRVFQGLIAALDAPELSVNLAARHSLRTLTGQNHDLEAEAWLAWYRQATRDGDPFAGAEQYLFPTYQRDDTLLEQIAFWNSNHFEHPGTPVGMTPLDQRTTYDDDAEER